MIGVPSSARGLRVLAAAVLVPTLVLGHAGGASAADGPPPPGLLGLFPPPPDPDDPGPGTEPGPLIPDDPGPGTQPEPLIPGVPAPGDDGRPAEVERLMRRAIVDLAGRELRNKARAEETGDNCSFYNAANDGPRCGIPWCNQFLRWVWREAGAVVAGLTYRPVSLREYGRRHDTWHPGAGLRGVRPGDAIAWRINDPPSLGHASIVVAVRGKRVTTIGGNEKGNTVRRTTWRKGDGRVTGYTSPVPRG